MRKIYLLSFCILVFLQAAIAQQSKLISVNFQQATIAQMVNDIESKSSYHFYYDPVMSDSLKTTLQVNDKSVEAILDLVFKNTDYHYAVTQQRIFITRGRQIRTDLAAGFSVNADSQVKQTTVVADYTEDKDKAVPEATTENKIYEIGLKTN